MKFYFFKYRPNPMVTEQRELFNRKELGKDIRPANSKSHLIRILKMLDIDVVKTSIEEIQ